MIDSSYDKQFITDKIKVICGTDEAGRGPLAGPVVAGACILPDGYIPDGLNDSKKLSEKKREKLYGEIIANALAYGIGVSTPEEIDQFNILEASLLAMRRAIDAMGIAPDFVLVDGCIDRGFSIPCAAIVGGDGKSPSIAAASILAKVTRDRMMVELDAEYPQYGFAKHKGYPTQAHKLSVFEFGPCPHHRKSFLSFLDRERDKLALKLEKKKNEQV